MTSDDDGPASKITLQGLRDIIDYRFEQPAHLHRGQYDELSAQERDDYDTQRLIWFGAGFHLNTAHTTRLLRSVRGYLRTQDRHAVGSQRVVVLDGEPHVGKTTMLTRLVMETELQKWRKDPDFRRHGVVPAVMIDTTASNSPKDIAASVLRFFGIPYKKRDSHGDLINQATEAILGYRTSVLIVDEMQMLLERRTGDGAINALKSLSNNTGVVTVLAGNRMRDNLQSPAAMQLLARGEVQEALPFSLSNPTNRVQWADLVGAVGRQMYLVDGETDLTPDARTLFDLSRGRIGDLRRILSLAMSNVIDLAEERGREVLLRSDITEAGGHLAATRPETGGTR